MGRAASAAGELNESGTMWWPVRVRTADTGMGAVARVRRWVKTPV